MSTGLNAFSEGGLYDFIQSPLYARGNPDVSLFIQILLEEKQWPGLGTFNIVTGGNLPANLQPADPNKPDYFSRVQHRAHYLNRNINYSGPDASYHVLDTYAQPGYPWATNGAPHYLLGNPTQVGPRDTGVFPSNPPAWNQDLTTGSATYDETANSFTNFVFTVNDPTYGTQTLTETLDTEIYSTDIIQTVQARILERLFDTPFDNLTPLLVFPEVFSEYDNYRFSGSLNPDAYDESPMPLPALQAFNIYSDAFFGPSLPTFHPKNSIDGSLEKYLFSYWNYENGDLDMAGLADASDAKGLNNKPVYASRCRFKISKSVPYFVADARIIDWLVTADAVTNRLTDVSVIKQGATTPNAIFDLGFVQDKDVGNFADQDFVQMPEDFGALSCGQIRFVILNETPQAWSARTGIATDIP